MTDRFVPDKPGWYWHADGIDNVYRDQRSKELRIWRGAQGFDESSPLSDIRDWIAPVPPPDVVDGLVAALEAVQTAREGHYWTPGIDAQIGAALQRYRGG